jgi:hypothetical protein
VAGGAAAATLRIGGGDRNGGCGRGGGGGVAVEARLQGRPHGGIRVAGGGPGPGGYVLGWGWGDVGQGAVGEAAPDGGAEPAGRPRIRVSRGRRRRFAGSSGRPPM